MIIKTLTCHDVYNYGASLQAYALLRFLSDDKNDVEIIEYKPEYMCDDYNFFVLPQYVREKTIVQKFFIFKLLYCLYLAPGRFATWQRIKPFKKFKKEYLRCTRRFDSLEALRMQPPKADLYIAGSDQIWNSNLPQGNDPAFFLNFGSDKTRRISYAASFGLNEIPYNKRSFIKKNLKYLDSISVREETGVNLLHRMGFNCCKVMDPVFLLTKMEWAKMIGKERMIRDRYVFVYDLYRTENDIKETAYRIAKERNFKIIVVNGKLPIKYGDVIIKNAGPIEFLNLLYYSEYVVTDSFHSTAFSLIFNRPFSVYNHKENSSRISDLLETLNLTTCFNSSKANWDIDWVQCNNHLKDGRQYSQNYLREQIVMSNKML